MKAIVIVHFDDDGVLAFTPEAFEEIKEQGLRGVKYYEYWMDKNEAKKMHQWLV